VILSQPDPAKIQRKEVRGFIDAQYITVRPDVLRPCKENLTRSVLRTFKRADPDYIERIVPLVCEQTWNAGVDYVRFAAIIASESTWDEQEKMDDGRFKPSPTSDYGPCQINHIHTRKHGQDFKYNMKKNINLGIWLFKSCRQSYSCYNGGGTEGYGGVARRFERMLRKNMGG